MSGESRVVIVTGGAGRVGKGITQRFHETGARVVIVDRDVDKINDAYDFLKIPKNARLPIAGDVALESTAEEMVEKTKEKFGRLDAVVTCVFDSTSGTATEVSLEDWNRCLAVTLTSAFLAAKYSVPAILETAGKGSITAISSIHSFNPAYSYITYAAAKAGLNHLVKAMAMDFSPLGIRVNGVATGGVSEHEYIYNEARDSVVAEHYPIGRYADALDIGDSVVFLASEKAAAITGQIIAVDGGSTVPLQHLLFNKVVAAIKADPKKFGIG